MCLSYRAKPIMAHFGPKMEPDFEAQNRPARKSAIFAKIGRFCPTLAEIGRLLGDFQAERHRQSARARLSSLRNIRTSSLVDETSTCLKSGGDSSSGDYGAFLSEMNSPQSARLVLKKHADGNVALSFAKTVRCAPRCIVTPAPIRALRGGFEQSTTVKRFSPRAPGSKIEQKSRKSRDFLSIFQKSKIAST